MILVGTTYAGADWATGSMSNQLLFEPRRLRVWATKALTAFLVCGVAAGVLLGAFWVALSLTADARGIATATPVLEQIRWMTARGVALAALGGLGGYALTMLLRHTVGTLALLFVYAAGGEALLALAAGGRVLAVQPELQRVRLDPRRHPGLRPERRVPARARPRRATSGSRSACSTGRRTSGCCWSSRCWSRRWFSAAATCPDGARVRIGAVSTPAYSERV